LIKFIGRPIDDFKTHYNRFKIYPVDLVGEPRYNLETVKGNYLISIEGREAQSSEKDSRKILTIIDGQAETQEEFSKNLDHFEQLVKTHFKQLPYYTFVNFEPYKFGELVTFNSYNEFFEKVRNEGIKSISHTWILDKGIVCHLVLDNTKLSFQIKGMPYLLVIEQNHIGTRSE
jgi:hypothetical protein